MNNFCTLFDSNYLTRGLAMYESLKKNSRDFHVFIFAFDDICYDILVKLELSDATIISLKEFENERLLSVKKTRTRGEYCWTCSSFTIKYVLEKYQTDSCTYIDADVYFFEDPAIMLYEMGTSSVLITEHRYPFRYKVLETNGKYCVQFIVFKNTPEGRKVLEWWSDRCIEWCYARLEDNKFGDQKYLDNFIDISKDVHVLEQVGGGVAPWNLIDYKIIQKDDNNKIILKYKNRNSLVPLLFFHFHDFKIFNDKTIQLSSEYYSIKKNHFILYKIYIKHLFNIKKKVLNFEKTINCNNILNKIKNNKGFIRIIFDKIIEKKQNGTKMSIITYAINLYNFLGIYLRHFNVYKINNFKDK